MSNKISWTDQTWNPIHGCSHAKSPGCDNCYARRMSKRLAGRHGYPPAPDNFKVTLRPDRLEQPLKWRKPRRIFVCSMSDLFHEGVPFVYVRRVFRAIAENPRHVYQILTKRPQRMREFFKWYDTFCNRLDIYPHKDMVDRFPNVWLGVTVENQQTADERIPLLLKTPAAVRFVSAEPLLEAVDLSRWTTDAPCRTVGVDCKDGKCREVWGLMLDWVITGGETGPGARPSHPDWFRSLRDQCVAARRVPFHFKQWGEWWPVDHDSTNHNSIDPSTKSCWLDIRGSSNPGYSAMMHEPEKLYRIGNARAGNLLDGVRWEQMPEAVK